MPHRALLIAASLLPLGACQMAGPTYTPQQMAYQQQQLASIIGPRMARSQQSCLLSAPSMNIQAVGNTLVARYGSQVYVNQVSGDCSAASGGAATLVFDTTPGGNYCNNSMVRVVDFGGAPVGSCALGSWTVYN